MRSRSIFHEAAAMLVIGLAMLTVSASRVLAQADAPLQLAYTIPLPDVRGRIDHFAIDPEDARLFVAALGNGSVEVVDLRSRTRSTRITGFQEPQGLGYVHERQQLFVANAGGGVDVFEGWPLRRVARIDGLEDADNVRYDVQASHVYVGYGRSLAVIGTEAHDLLGSIRLAGHPESFQLESAGTRIFVNVPTARHIAIVDRERRTVVGQWTIDDASANFPMALDQAGHRLFVATRHPALLLAYDTDSGTRTASIPIGGDADDLFYDAKRRRIYVICGEGVIDVVQQRDVDHYAAFAHVRTERGARTGLFAEDMLYVAIPARGTSPAEIRAYAIK